MTESDQNLTQDELEAERGDMLPDREAMSLISADPTQTDAALPIDGSENYGAVGQAQGAGAVAGDAAADAREAGATDAAGSSTGSESVTSEDRSDHIQASDTATAG
jgi:hypothetical protein